MSEQLYCECKILELEYLALFGKDETGFSDSSLIPIGWAGFEDYETKKKVLEEAISKKIRIVETDAYLDMQEGIKSK